jgi:hypothetical protein
MPQGFVDFEFDLADALLASLIKVFDKLESAPLLPNKVADIPEAQGVYMLLLEGKIIYIGKTDAEAGLRHRLERHAFTIQHRQNLSVRDVSFKAVRLYVFTPMDLETQLIKHYRKTGPVTWNKSGFGSNDPGRNRDNTKQRPKGFDALYPIDIDQNVLPTFPRKGTAATIAMELKKYLPYTFRFEGSGEGRQAHPELQNAQVNLPAGQLTTRAVVEGIIKLLPTGWQATILAGRIIMYRENQDYKFGTIIARSNKDQSEKNR